MKLRPASADDFSAAYRVGLMTGNSGQDASDLFTLPDLIGDIYVGPYLEFCLDTCWVLVDDSSQVVGYVLGCPDTTDFEARCRDEWWPRVQSKYSQSQAITSLDYELLEAIRNPSNASQSLVAQFPAHGHIDLIESAQGQGWGKVMMKTMMNALREMGAPGMFLDVSVHNHRALGFYASIGFTEFSRNEDACCLTLTF